MSEEVAAAQQAIQQILARLNIGTVICIDDIYAVNDSNVEFVIGWFSAAKSQRMVEECKGLLVGLPFDANDDEVWKRALRTHWERFTDDERKSILDGLAKILNYSADIERDLGSASLLRHLIPKDVSLMELGPIEWEQDKDTLLGNEQGLLCLFDHNLQYAGYSKDHGISLLDKTIDVGGDRPVICGLLTHMVKEGQEITRGQEFADRISRKRKDFLVLSKDRLIDPMRFAHGLKMMSLNHARDFLTNQVCEIAEEADKQANDKLMEVDIHNFDYMVLRSSEKEGAWEAETLFRLFEIFRRVTFRRRALALENRDILNERIAQIRAIREVKTVVDEERYPRDQQWEIRQLELYESEDFVNGAHLPIDLGDIFEVGKKKLILIVQPCDLMVRKNGHRSAEILTLVNITTTGSGSSFALDYFNDQTGERAYVKFRSSYHISADVLDLAVFNSDGHCRFDSSAIVPPFLHIPLRNRFNEISNKFQRYQRQLDELYQKFENINLSNTAEAYLEKSLVGRMTQSNLDIPLNYGNNVFEFGICRIGRYRQPGAGRLLNSYFSFLSSITAQCREQMCEIGYVNRPKMSIKLLQHQIYVQDYQFFGYFEGLNTRFRTNGRDIAL